LLNSATLFLLFTEDYIKNITPTQRHIYSSGKKKRKRKGKLNETTSADPDDHGENDVFNLGDVDAAGSSVDPEYDLDTQSPDAKINGEGRGV
jgi:hypothetical protein